MEELKQKILKELKIYQLAWSQWPGNPHTDAKAEAMRIAICAVEKVFKEVEDNE